MPDSSKRTTRCNVQHIERLRSARGWSIDELANRAGVSKRTVERLLSGQRVAFDTVRRIAKALSIEGLSTLVSQLQPDEVPVDSATRFDYSISIRGRADPEVSRAQTARITPEVLENLKAAGVEIHDVEVSTSTSATVSYGIRILSVVWVRQENGDPGWVLVAVRKGCFGDFTIQAESGTLDLHDFPRLGEIITAGHGKRPPEAVIREAARLYRCNADAVIKRLSLQLRPDDANAHQSDID